MNTSHAWKSVLFGLSVSAGSLLLACSAASAPVGTSSDAVTAEHSGHKPGSSSGGVGSGSSSGGVGSGSSSAATVEAKYASSSLFGTYDLVSSNPPVNADDGGVLTLNPVVIALVTTNLGFPAVDVAAPVEIEGTVVPVGFFNGAIDQGELLSGGDLLIGVQGANGFQTDGTFNSALTAFTFTSNFTPAQNIYGGFGSEVISASLTEPSANEVQLVVTSVDESSNATSTYTYLFRRQ
jgi:hypothetical protein